MPQIDDRRALFAKRKSHKHASQNKLFNKVAIFGLFIKISVLKTTIKCLSGRISPTGTLKSSVLTSKFSLSEPSFVLDAGGGEDTGGRGLVIIWEL